MMKSWLAACAGVALGAAILASTGAAAVTAVPADAAPADLCPSAAAASEEPSPRTDCCFTNRSYAGVCVVKPERDETCTSILAYLNNPRSQGKNYCGGTNIRGGWEQVPCEVPPPPPGEYAGR